MSELRSYPIYHPTFGLLNILRCATFDALSQHSVPTILNETDQWRSTKEGLSNICFLVSDNVVFGMARMYFGILMDATAAIISIFHTSDESADHFGLARLTRRAVIKDSLRPE